MPTLNQGNGENNRRKDFNINFQESTLLDQVEKLASLAYQTVTLLNTLHDARKVQQRYCIQLNYDVLVVFKLFKFKVSAIFLESSTL